MSRKTKEDSMKTRSQLLEAALEVFSKKSFSDVTLSEIAGQVGMTKGALYWHFKNKNDLLLQLIEEICLDSEKEFAEKFRQKNGTYYCRDLKGVSGKGKVVPCPQCIADAVELTEMYLESVK